MALPDDLPRASSHIPGRRSRKRVCSSAARNGDVSPPFQPGHNGRLPCRCLRCHVIIRLKLAMPVQRRRHGDRQHLRQSSGSGIRRKRSDACAAAGWPRPPSSAIPRRRIWRPAMSPTQCRSCTSPTGGAQALPALPSTGAISIRRDGGCVTDVLFRSSPTAATASVNCCGNGRYADWVIDNLFCRPTIFRRITARYGKIAANFLSGVVLATTSAVSPWMSRPSSVIGGVLRMYPFSGRNITQAYVRSRGYPR